MNEWQISKKRNTANDTTPYHYWYFVRWRDGRIITTDIPEWVQEFWMGDDVQT